MQGSGDKDDADFAALMAKQGVKPLLRAQRPPESRKPPVRPVSQDERRRQAETFTAIEPSAAAPGFALEWLGGEDRVQYRRDGVTSSVFRKLRERDYGQPATVDLHGLRVEQANAALHRFLRDCRRRGTRSALVIHGKGYHARTEDGHRDAKPAQLKSHVVYWLKNHPDILAFASADERDGGSGALSVLIRRERDPEPG